MVNLAPVLVLMMAVSCSLQAAVIQLDFRATPAVVEPLKTANTTLKCLVQERDDYYETQSRQLGYYSGQTSQVIAKRGVGMIRILKNTQSSWKPIAQMSNVAPNTVHVLDSSISNSDGVITEDATRQSFLQISWDVATADVFGTYRCDVISFDSQQTALLTTSSELSLGKALDALAFLRLLKNKTSDIERALAEHATHYQTNRNLIERTVSDLQALKNETTWKHNELEQTVLENNKVLKSQGSELGTRIQDMAGEMTEVFNKMQKQLSFLFASGFFMLWPQGSYALLKPQSGCPVVGMTTWKSGWRRHHTESSDRNKDFISEGNHLPTSCLERKRGNNFATQHFCVKTEANSLGPVWPRGSYCINKKGDCPGLFHESFITWDEENDEVLHTLEGEVPDGVFNDSDVTTVQYCCRKDGSANDTVYLPTSDPFYLYRYGGQCQNVHGMNVSEEFVVFDTENTGNKDAFSLVHPDGQVNNVRLELCYYQRE